MSEHEKLLTHCSTSILLSVAGVGQPHIRQMRNGRGFPQSDVTSPPLQLGGERTRRNGTKRRSYSPNQTCTIPCRDSLHLRLALTAGRRGPARERTWGPADDRGFQSANIDPPGSRNVKPGAWPGRFRAPADKRGPPCASAPRVVGALRRGCRRERSGPCESCFPRPPTGPGIRPRNEAAVSLAPPAAGRVSRGRFPDPRGRKTLRAPVSPRADSRTSRRRGWCPRGAPG